MQEGWLKLNKEVEGSFEKERISKLLGEFKSPSTASTASTLIGRRAREQRRREWEDDRREDRREMGDRKMERRRERIERQEIDRREREEMRERELERRIEREERRGTPLYRPEDYSAENQRAREEIERREREEIEFERRI